MFKKVLNFVVLSVLAFQGVGGEVHSKGLEPIVAYQVCDELAGVKTPYVLLSGDWEFKYDQKSKWEIVKVPGELAMQGYAIEHDVPYWYKKRFVVPKDYKGMRTILRFDGVYSYAKLYVNGEFVRQHTGGFTRWETDITPFVKVGRSNEIKLEIIDPIDEISYGSGYAHHPIGGILRDVSILAQPETNLKNFFIETDLDESYKDAKLKIGYTVTSATESQVDITLTDPNGKVVKLPKNQFNLKEGESIQEIDVQSPMKWDAEHPNLYTLSVRVSNDGQMLSEFSKKVGFRKIVITGDQLLVNGMPVKLRGACRHDIHPELGRMTTPYLDSLDAVLFKQSNMNFARTSHYPPTEAFVNYCDQMGIYVECETAVCFIGTHRQKNYHPHSFTQDSIDFKNRYLSQCEEMVRTFRSNSSVILWSVGNECVYGSNFRASWDLVKGMDSTRPVVFSYPGLSKEDKIYDILSMHYQDAYGNLNQYGVETRGFQHKDIPVLFDEWAHPACYTYETLQNDPNIREFWGKSLDMMWSGVFDARGALGGAIWGYIDEVFMVPEPKKGDAFWKTFTRVAKPVEFQGKSMGYGEWGIVDVWRRLKPEFWATQKAYSPVKVLTTKVDAPLKGQPVIIPVYNRFDHTNLSEVQLHYTYDNETQIVNMPDVKPHQKGFISIAGMDWNKAKYLDVSFVSANGQVIDSDRITLGAGCVEVPKGNRQGSLNIEETNTQFIVKGDGFEIPFSKQSGLIEKATADGKIIIENGPFLHLGINLNHLSGAEVRKRAKQFLTNDSTWCKRTLSVVKEGDLVQGKIVGTYQDVELSIFVTILPQGEMQMSYQVEGQPNGYIRETGLKFEVPIQYNWLSWKRKGYWSYYPENSLSSNEGSTSFYDSKQIAYAEEPTQPWAKDTHNYFYWADKGANVAQPLTQMAKGMKEHVYNYTLSSDNTSKGALTVVSNDASVACRTEKSPSDRLMLHVNNQWDYPEIAWGNYCKKIEAVPCYGSVKIVF